MPKSLKLLSHLDSYSYSIASQLLFLFYRISIPIPILSHLYSNSYSISSLFLIPNKFQFFITTFKFFLSKNVDILFLHFTFVQNSSPELELSLCYAGEKCWYVFFFHSVKMSSFSISCHNLPYKLAQS